jgi:hypothetical protein
VRSTLDLDHINTYFLAPQETILGGKAYVYDPWLDMSLPKGWVVPNIIRSKPYMRPDIPNLPELATNRSGIVSYSTKSGRRLAAFLKTSDPEFLFVVERPLRDVLAPIETMGKITLATLVAMLFVISVAVFRMANPLLKSWRDAWPLSGTSRPGFLTGDWRQRTTTRSPGLPGASTPWRRASRRTATLWKRQSVCTAGCSRTR